MSYATAPALGESKHEEDVTRDVDHSAMPERYVAPGLHNLPTMTSIDIDKTVREGERRRGESAQFSGVRLPLDNQAAEPMDEDGKYHAYHGKPIVGRESENATLIPPSDATQQIFNENKDPQSIQQQLSAKIVAKYLIDNGRESVLHWLQTFLQPKQISMTDASTQTLRESGTQTGEDPTESTMRWTGMDGQSLLPLVNWQDQRSLLPPLMPFPNPEGDFEGQKEAATSLEALLMAVDMVEEGEEADPLEKHHRKRRRGGGLPILDTTQMQYPYLDPGFKTNYPFLNEDVGGAIRSELTSGADPNEMPVIVASLNANAERLQARQQGRAKGMNSLISTPAAFRVAGDKNEPFFKSPLGHGSLPPQPRRYSPPANNRLPGRMNRKRAASALSFDDPGVDRDENGTEGQEDAPGYNEEEHPVPLQVDKKKKEVKRGGSASKPGSTMTKAVRVSLPGSEEDEDEEDEGDLIGSSPANVDPDPHPDSPLPVPSVRIPKETLPDLFILPINEAAAKMGISVPQLKEACMEHGIIRWPFKKLSSLEVLIATVDAASKLQPGDPNATQMELVLQQLSGKGLLSKLREIKASILNHADFEVPIEVARLKQALNKSKKK